MNTTLQVLEAAKNTAERAMVDCVDAGGPDSDDPYFQEAAAKYRAACKALDAAKATNEYLVYLSDSPKLPPLGTKQEFNIKELVRISGKVGKILRREKKK